MNINNVTSTGSVFQQESMSKKDKKIPQENPKKDNLKISSQAKEIVNAQEISPKQKAQITHRLSTGFYDEESTLNKVADEILQSKEFNEEIKK